VLANATDADHKSIRLFLSRVELPRTLMATTRLLRISRVVLSESTLLLPLSSGCYSLSALCFVFPRAGVAIDRWRCTVFAEFKRWKHERIVSCRYFNYCISQEKFIQPVTPRKSTACNMLFEDGFRTARIIREQKTTYATCVERL